MGTVNTAKTSWQGNLAEGKGSTELVTSGVATFDVAWAKRAESGQGMTNPEELISAAQATCFCMALAHGLGEAGFTADKLECQAETTFVPGEGITGIKLIVSGEVPGLSAEQFADFAHKTADACPVSQALKAVPHSVEIR